VGVVCAVSVLHRSVKAGIPAAGLVPRIEERGREVLGELLAARQEVAPPLPALFRAALPEVDARSEQRDDVSLHQFANDGPILALMSGVNHFSPDRWSSRRTRADGRSCSIRPRPSSDYKSQRCGLLGPLELLWVANSLDVEGLDELAEQVLHPSESFVSFPTG